MNLKTLRTFLGWCTSINLGILLFSTVGIILFADFAGSLHGDLFDLHPTFIRQSMYQYLSFYKIAFIVFNLVPWLALIVMEGKGDMTA